MRTTLAQSWSMSCCSRCWNSAELPWILLRSEAPSCGSSPPSTFVSSSLKFQNFLAKVKVSDHPISVQINDTSNVILESEVSTLTASKPIEVSIGPASIRGRKTLIHRGQLTPGSSFSLRVVQHMLNLGSAR